MTAVDTPLQHGSVISIIWMALCCAALHVVGCPNLLAADKDLSILDHFMVEAAASLDFTSRDNGLSHVLRFDLDVTGDGQAEVFLGVGPTGRAGTDWDVYSPGPDGRYTHLARLFFHPGGFCYDADEHLLLLSQRVEPHRFVVAGYRFSARGAEWVHSSKELSDVDTRFPQELQALASCPNETQVLAASPREVARGLPAWVGLLSGERIEPQPPSLSDLKLRSPSE